MRPVNPEVYLIARPSIDRVAMRSYLKDVEGACWLNNRPSTPQTLIEFAGRLCYRSWKPGLNANVKKIRKDQDIYLQNIIASKHGSVLEHANFTFVFHNVSRVFTHELVRHRAGVAISQESLRFVRLDELKVWLPDALRSPPRASDDRAGTTVPTDPPSARTDGLDAPPTAHQEFMTTTIEMIETLEHWQKVAANHYGLDDDGIPFSYKKYITSALRRLAPIGLATDIVWTANIRTLRHVIEARTLTSAEEEIRLIFDRVGTIMRDECPDLFSDFKVSSEGCWIPEWSKI